MAPRPLERELLTTSPTRSAQPARVPQQSSQKLEDGRSLAAAQRRFVEYEAEWRRRGGEPPNGWAFRAELLREATGDLPDGDRTRIHAPPFRSTRMEIPKDPPWAEMFDELDAGPDLVDEIEEAMLRGGSDDATRVEMVAACQRAMSRLAAMQACFITEVLTDPGKDSEAKGRAARSLPEELSARLAVTGYAGQQLVDRAAALEHAPEVKQALLKGRIDARKADLFVSETQTVPPSQARAIQRDLLPAAQRLTAPELRRRLAAAVVAVDADLARERREKARESRTVSMTPAADGMAWLTFYMGAEDALTAFTALDALAGKKEAGDDREVGARRVDAFTQLMTETLSSGRTPGGSDLGSRQGRRPGLELLISAATMAGGLAPGFLSGFGPIGAEHARELAEQALRGCFLETDPATGTVLTSLPPHPLLARAGPPGGGLSGSGAPGTGLSGIALSGPGRSGKSGPGPAWPGSGASGTSPRVPDPGGSGPPTGSAAALSGAGDGYVPSRTLDRPAPEFASWAPPPRSSSDELAGGRLAAYLITSVAAATQERTVDPVRFLREAFGVLVADSYQPTTALRDLVKNRDQTCRFPGCLMPSWRCQLDHIAPFDPAVSAWAQTTEPNLQLLCGRHHQMKTDRLWSVSRSMETGSTRWISPTRHAYTVPAECVDPDRMTASYQEALALLRAEHAGDADLLDARAPLDPGTADELDPANLASAGRSADEVATALRAWQREREPVAATFGDPPF